MKLLQIERHKRPSVISRRDVAEYSLAVILISLAALLVMLACHVFMGLLGAV